MTSAVKKKKIVVILGPTASGKSALAVRLARQFNGEVVSADSRQIYRGLNIGSGKITGKEMRGIPHHLLDVADPRDRFSVSEYQKLAREKIAEIFSRGRLPIVCGGTGFYISALLGGETIPDVPPNEKLRAKLNGKTPETLLKMLKRLDPARAKTVDQKNPRRIIRAIEIAVALGKVPKIKHRSKYNALKIGIAPEKNNLRKRITIRLFARIREGMVAEAKKLRASGLSLKRMDELGLEYRYLAKYLKNEMSKSEMVEKLDTEIWRYARRQMTWFRRDKEIRWFKPGETKKISKTVREFLR